jgi:hypothetical protein
MNVPPSPSARVKSGAEARASATVVVEEEVDEETAAVTNEEVSVVPGCIVVALPEPPESPHATRLRATTARAAVRLMGRGYKSLTVRRCGFKPT